MQKEIFSDYTYTKSTLTKAYSPTEPLTDVGKWKKLSEDLDRQGKYLTGSWGVWKDQASVFLNAVDGVVKEKGDNLNILRLGLSSPEALKQETNLLKIGGVNVQLSIIHVIDFNKEPLSAAKDQAYEDLVQADARYLPFPSSNYDLITSHFLFSYLQEREKEKSAMALKEDDEQKLAVLKYKNSIIKNVFRCLKDGGLFIMAQGINSSLAAWKSENEIVENLIDGGFIKNQIKIIPTTDPYDNEEVDGKLVPKTGINFIFLATKT